MSKAKPDPRYPDPFLPTREERLHEEMNLKSSVKEFGSCMRSQLRGSFARALSPFALVSGFVGGKAEDEDRTTAAAWVAGRGAAVHGLFSGSYYCWTTMSDTMRANLVADTNAESRVLAERRFTVDPFSIPWVPKPSYLRKLNHDKRLQQQIPYSVLVRERNDDTGRGTLKDPTGALAQRDLVPPNSEQKTEARKDSVDLRNLFQNSVEKTTMFLERSPFLCPFSSVRTKWRKILREPDQEEVITLVAQALIEQLELERKREEMLDVHQYYYCGGSSVSRSQVSAPRFPFGSFLRGDGYPTSSREYKFTTSNASSEGESSRSTAGVSIALEQLSAPTREIFERNRLNRQFEERDPTSTDDEDWLPAVFENLVQEVRSSLLAKQQRGCRPCGESPADPTENPFGLSYERSQKFASTASKEGISPTSLPLTARLKQAMEEHCQRYRRKRLVGDFFELSPSTNA